MLPSRSSCQATPYSAPDQTIEGLIEFEAPFETRVSTVVLAPSRSVWAKKICGVAPRSSFHAIPNPDPFHVAVAGLWALFFLYYCYRGPGHEYFAGKHGR